ncbi:MAG TPA: lysylphosphatidylglycerol synthase transmembrane domain-containing protein [Candidatus Saccharimonadaceae bacterium]|nr:lysylphosphatidylglycerol synthase transmembrane domain-containing protein [Candidatus Saccharimonadaceae bacterium]
MSFKGWLSVITFVLIAVILFFSRHELVYAWRLLERVNIWILLLLIPAQLLDYLSVGKIIFSYLQRKGSLEKLPAAKVARISLELNFVNHVLPSGGVSGFSYMNWRLGRLGVAPGRAAMSQVVRYTMAAFAYVLLLMLAVIAVTIDGSINRWVILASSMLVSVMIGLILAIIYVVSSKRRMEKFALWSVRAINRFVYHITFGHKRRVVAVEAVNSAFMEMHNDFLELRRDRRALLQPLGWALLYTIFDVSLFMVTFWALGDIFNPAPVLIAYGIATVAGFIVITPGGVGAYEALMVAFLALAGIAQGEAIAGIVLTRVIVLVTTIGLGYVFYQRALGEAGDGGTPAV